MDEFECFLHHEPSVKRRNNEKTKAKLFIRTQNQGCMAVVLGKSDELGVSEEVRCPCQPNHRVEKATVERHTRCVQKKSAIGRRCRVGHVRASRQIHQLTMENDLLEPGLTRVHEPQGKKMVTRAEPFRSLANAICWIYLTQCSIT